MQNTGEGGLQYGTQQSMEVVADMQGAVDVDSDAMGSAWVCHMYTTINHGVRIQQSTVGYIQHQPWVSIIDVLIPNQQRTSGYFMGRVVEYRPDTTIDCLVSRGNMQQRGEISAVQVCGCYYVWVGFDDTITLQS